MGIKHSSYVALQYCRTHCQFMIKILLKWNKMMMSGVKLQPRMTMYYVDTLMSLQDVVS